MRNRTLAILISFAFSLFLLASCGGKDSSSPTLTFQENSCSYSGPSTIAAEFTLAWNIVDSNHDGYIYEIVTLDEDKSVQELSTIPAEEPPPSWVHKINYGVELNTGQYTKTIDLTSNAAFREGPIYIVCFYADKDMAIGAVGPLSINK